ncbi:tRNA preQ1(34) S-adenosylmethionine ribosyltransferase-isomerase QueA [Candidatus Gottesmanbacteria bacterium]|nr:tRNA preQ1(34) S-adenosylmethionine ribosyltransferase-isomerase QueA [Candidatus Gottesmanbacteria bacterium]
MKFTQISDYDYVLPRSLIAQSPISPRESARLMIVDRKNDRIEHKHVRDLPMYISKNDVIVLNNSKVFKARLHGTIDGIQKPVEIFLIRPHDEYSWIAIGKPGKKLITKTRVNFSNTIVGTITHKYPDGSMLISFPDSIQSILDFTDRFGEVPVPPYISKIPKEYEYQTSYASVVGSVAAPTAGFHLTKNIRYQITKTGALIIEITLHVGLGTFLPVKTKFLEEHTMHSEWVSVSRNSSKIIMDAKREKKRIIAIGTTTARVLEGVATTHDGLLCEYSGDINLFITPGFQFQIVDALFTNFHLPKSTLLILIRTFGGDKLLKRAYKEAIEKQYRFYSFGDAMLIL